jgi:rhamnogalacturonan endolyase
MVVALLAGSGAAAADLPHRQMEALDRGVVAVRQDDGTVWVSWRLLGTEASDLAFTVHRRAGDGPEYLLTPVPLTGPTHWVDRVAPDAMDITYIVRGVSGDDHALNPERGFALRADTPVRPYLAIPLQAPAGYRANDASAADLTGDGRYEIIVHLVGEGRDNAHDGLTTEPIFHAYTLEGDLLWEINLGRNIREGAHYTQFLVYDFDGDGRAEFVGKTADGTRDGLGRVIGDPAADWRTLGGEVPTGDRTGARRGPDGTLVAPLEGRILAGPEYLTVFDGRTGAALATTDYLPPRHPQTHSPTPAQLAEVWGDGYGNRSDRFLAGVAYLDGERPSLVMARGYYTRAVLAAWDWRDGRLTHRWTFDSHDGTPGNLAYAGQGNHQLAVADVTGDGRDDIIYGQMVVRSDGTGLYSTGLGHGDSLHVSDLDPTRPGLEVFGPLESPRHNGGLGTALRDARTGKILWSTPAESDVGRGVAFDIDPRHPGHEVWASNSSRLYSVRGEVIADGRPAAMNFAVWWDGDLLRELLDQNHVSKWNWETATTERIFTAEGAVSINGTKATPSLSADLFGDWREEIVLPSADGSELRIYTTTIPTEHRLYTLMHDPVYRLAIAWQNVAYNQPPHPGFFLGDGMAPAPRPRIVTRAVE